MSTEPLDPARLAEIRAAVATHHYDDPEVAELLAEVNWLDEALTAEQLAREQAEADRDREEERYARVRAERDAERARVLRVETLAGEWENRLKYFQFEQRDRNEWWRGFIERSSDAHQELRTALDDQ